MQVLQKIVKHFKDDKCEEKKTESEAGFQERQSLLRPHLSLSGSVLFHM